MIDVVKQNPQLLMDAMGEGIAKKRKDVMKQLSADVAGQRAEISSQSMKFGKLDAKKSMICFFDPLCKHCIEFQKSMVKLIKAKKDVRFELLPVAVLGEDSVTLAKVIIAAYKKSAAKAIKLIEKITESENEMDKAAIEKALKTAGFDSKEIEGMLTEVDKKLVANGALAEKLKIPVVPAIFFINENGDISMIQATAIAPLSEIIDGKPQSEKNTEEESVEEDEK
jgi:protein-disulfide isomerase